MNADKNSLAFVFVLICVHLRSSAANSSLLSSRECPREPAVRIVQLVENLEVGGLERLAVDLAIAQKQAGHHSIVYCLHEAGPLAGRLEDAGIPVVAFRKAPGFSVRTVLAMATSLGSDRVDVIHGHNPGVHHYAALAARIAGVPVCINTRHSALTSKGLPYQERYFRWVKPLTGQVVFDCDYVRRLLEDKLQYPAEKCSVILNGIPLEGFLARPASPGSRLPRIRFGTIGRLVPAKGHAILIDAFALLCRQVPEAELSIFGYGSLDGAMGEQIARLGLSGKVGTRRPHERFAGRARGPGCLRAFLGDRGPAAGDPRSDGGGAAGGEYERGRDSRNRVEGVGMAVSAR